MTDLNILCCACRRYSNESTLPSVWSILLQYL